MKKIIGKILATIIFGILVSVVYKYIGFKNAVLMMLIAIYVEVLLGDKENE